MAGSYNHVKKGFSMIENMRDARETMVELLWLVERYIGEENVQQALDEYFYPMDRGKRSYDRAYHQVMRLMGK